ncbi:MAG: sulfite exporter TauE/SafE family protein [Gammaproteobacteria bacterium]|jgi:uncharacterized membrane protein YfcA
MNFYILLYPLIGVLAGLLSGMLGIGGGIIVVPGLAFVFAHFAKMQGFSMHMAEGTSLAIMIITAISSIYAHHQRENILWPLFLRLLPGILIGVISGAIFAGYLPARILEIIFGVFVFLMALRMFLLIKSKPTRKLPSWPWLSLIAFIIGGKSGLLGIGGGAITIPFLNYCNVPMRKASGTSIACTLPIAIVGAISFAITGFNVVTIPYSIGYIYLPAFFGVAVMSLLFAPVGAALSGKVDVALVKRIFGVLLFVASIKMILS